MVIGRLFCLQYSAKTLCSKLDRQAVCCHWFLVFDNSGGKGHKYTVYCSPEQRQILGVRRIHAYFVIDFMAH